MASIQAIRSTAQSALSGLNRSVSRLDDVAQRVASGIRSNSDDDGGTFTEKIGALAELPEIAAHARANMKVLNSVEDLYADFLTRPRR